jgi:2-polyprenyl-3-methyl-5-hydroxy-6-metoxy-1,4-benzoquinol methylase
MGDGKSYPQAGGFVSDRCEEVEYWTAEWSRRNGPDGVTMNLEKMAKVIYELAIRRRYYNIEKLDIGCGTGIHATILSSWSRGWKERWTGIDLANSAVQFAQLRGYNAICGDFLKTEFDKKFECILLLDSFEHFSDRRSLAKKILNVTEKRFFIFMNIPMYSQAHAKHEYMIGGKDIPEFLSLLGHKEDMFFNHDIYGSHGHPYMWVEALCGY